MMQNLSVVMREMRDDPSTDLPKCANGSYSIVTSRYLNSSDNIDLQRETRQIWSHYWTRLIHQRSEVQNISYRQLFYAIKTQTTHSP